MSNTTIINIYSDGNTIYGSCVSNNETDTNEFDFDEECSCDCENCPECNEYEPTDSDDAEMDLIEDTLKKIIEVEGCPECTLEALMELAEIFRDIGYADCKAEMQAVLDDME